jgi:uncharacterized protein (DUF983 family)
MAGAAAPPTKERTMVTCPRCGNDAEYLADDTFVLIRCEFCGDDIDATDLVPAGDTQAA